jgi:hypothetical protein
MGRVRGLMMMGIAMIFIAVGFTVYPIVMTGTDAILAYAYSSNATFTDNYYTGLTSVTGILPLIILMGYVSAAVITGFMGVKMMRSGDGAISPAGLIELAMGLIFISIGIIIFPVVLDGISSVLHNGGTAISSSYTGLTTVLKIVPLIVLTAFMAGGIVAGFFGVKSMGKASG